MADVVLSLGRHGRVRGLMRADGTCRFLGIPYAYPPTGARRWCKPEPLPAGHLHETPEREPMDCTQFRGVCPQEIYVIDGKAFNDLKGVGAFNEDCLTLNIWTPAAPGTPEVMQNWPVLVFIHGGWLQIGNPSFAEHYHPYELYPDLRFVVASIGYRTNAFGFLAGEGVDGNFGFWDQRAGLEWVQKYIHHFGGDASKVTLFGHSAGGFSAHTQLQYELLHTDGSKPLFKNVFLCSNAIPAQPKKKEEANHQFEEFCDLLGVSKSISPGEKLDVLRGVSAKDIVNALPKMKMSNFRAVTDNEIIHDDMIEKFTDGTFAKLFAARGYRIMVGEVETEQHLYSRWLPPKSPEDLPIKLQNYYSSEVVQKLLAHPGYKGETVDVFSRIVSDMQVRAPIRNLCKQLVDNGVPVKSILRYRVAWRPKFFDDLYPPEAGVTHGADQYMWWGGKRYGYTEEEWGLLKEWLGVTLRRLVYGEEFDHAIHLKSYLLLGPDGKAGVVKDQAWDHLMSVVEAISK